MAEPFLEKDLVDHPRFQEDVRLTLSLDRDTVQGILDLLRKALINPTPKIAAQVAQAIGKPTEQAARLLTLFGHWYRRRRKLELDAEQFKAELLKLAEITGVEEYDEVSIDLLTEVLAAQPEVDRENAKLAATAVTPMIDGAQFTWELRAAQGPIGQEPLGLAPVLIMRFEMDEPFYGQRAIILHLPEELFEKFREALSRSDVALKKLKEKLGEFII